MKSQVKKTIALSGSAAILVLAVGFSDGNLSPNGATTTRSASIALAFRPPLLPQDLSLTAHLAEVIARVTSGTGPVGQAHAGGPTCVTDSTNQCPPALDESVNPPSPPRTQRVCRPAGMFGQHCYQRLLP